MIGVSTGISIGSFGIWSLATGVPVPSSLGQEAGTMIDDADMSDASLTIQGNAYNRSQPHPSLYGQSVAFATPAGDGAATGTGILKTFSTPVSVATTDTITVWFWQEYPSGDANSASDYPNFTGDTRVNIFVYDTGTNYVTYQAPMSWSRTRGWTAITLDFSSDLTGVTKGVMATPVSGSGNNSFLTTGIGKILISPLNFGVAGNDNTYKGLQTPLIYGGMVKNQKHTPFFMPYFDDGYRYVIDGQSSSYEAADGFINTLNYMTSQNQVGTLGIIADRILDQDGAYFSPRDIHDLYLAGWDIGLHSAKFWGRRGGGCDEIKPASAGVAKYTLTCSGTTATLSAVNSWTRNPIAAGSSISVKSAAPAGYDTDNAVVTRVDDRTVTFTVGTADLADATAFVVDSSWGPIMGGTIVAGVATATDVQLKAGSEADRNAAKAAVKADMNYNLEFLQDPYTKLTAAGHTGIEYLNGVDWTRGDCSCVLPGNAWRESGEDWAWMIQTSLDELGINSARGSIPAIESSKTFAAATNNDHYPTDFFVGGAIIENDHWLNEVESTYNPGYDSTVNSIVNTVIPAIANQGNIFTPMIHILVDEAAAAEGSATKYHRDDWHAICAAANSNGLQSITATQYAKLQREAGDATSSVTGLEHLDASVLTATETTAIANFRRRLMRMNFWGSLKGLWIPALTGDNAKTNMITGVDLTTVEQGTGPGLTYGTRGIEFSVGTGAAWAPNNTFVQTDISVSDLPTTNYTHSSYDGDYYDNYAFGVWVDAITQPTNSGVLDFISTSSLTGNYGASWWDSDDTLRWSGGGTYSTAGSTINLSYTPTANTLIANSRRGGRYSEEIQGHFGNKTLDGDLDFGLDGTGVFAVGGKATSGFTYSLNADWTASVIFIGEGMSYNQLLMESAIKKLMSDLGY